MKTKIGPSVLTASLLALIYFLIPFPAKKNLDNTQKASFYSIKCTIAKFLLNDVDTTQQIAPLFENLGNLNFSISTKEKLAQTFFNPLYAIGA